METLLVLIVVWFGASVGLLVLLYGRSLAAAWREPVLGFPVLIFESDDWGPGPDDDATALRNLAATLAEVRDSTGRPAVMTLGIVAAIANGPAILASGNSRYVRRTLADPDFAAVLGAMRAGCRSGVFALQRHGLEHFWPASVLARLAGDSGAGSGEADVLQRWLRDVWARSEDLPAPLQSRWVDCAHLPSTALAPAEIDRAVCEEADLLRQVFGATLHVAVPNTFVWDDNVERAWVASGVRCVVTPGCRYEARDEAGKLVAPTRRMHNGARGCGDVCYVVRDVYFEPMRGHRAERVWEALAAKVAEGRPTLLETHRANFIGPAATREAALAELERALRGALLRHPDLRFMSTAELADALCDVDSPGRVRMWRRRLAAWCVRVGHEPGMARLLRFSGLGAILQAAGYLLGDVTFRRSPDPSRC
ncbi:hypothetical protein [Aromatoleum petrolei]|uniref:Glycosyl hydrolase n=1 Tax=Aromatoleum petrolei TaxID=76116 RepID=A0ABX1MMM0_9RHOO|nr:hypothetical protein [Aromatoleum petrolei]NMF87374.1 hypothetical protein [Aromatoleum petrolei]QTQ35741.1 Uncharacterized protein ToN1_15840 [Aromatoleum petrolei]